ncbi:rhodanese-like domain-containing protein [bacterium]|nr:rhodanese-like domain-containing protein [bacterium]
MKYALLLFASLFATSWNASFAQNKVAKTTSAAEFEQGLKANKAVQLVDVRSAGEFAEGHLPNAQNIDINSGDFDQKVAKLDKTKPVYVYCAVGGRSAKAMSKLQKMGFVEILNLDGGIKAWSREGKKVVR